MLKRPYETRYFGSISMRDPSKAVSRGFPKAEEGSIEGAAKAVAKGWVRKVQCIERSTERVLWTVKAGPRVRGVNIIPTVVTRGDDAGPGRAR